MKPLLALIAALLLSLTVWFVLFKEGAGAAEKALQATAQDSEQSSGGTAGAADLASGEPTETLGRSQAEGQAEAPEELASTEARWVEGRVEWPAGVPADPTLEVFAMTERVGAAQLASLLDPPLRFDDPWPHTLDSRARAESLIVARTHVAADGSFRLPYGIQSRSGFLSLRGRHLYLKQALELDPRDTQRKLVVNPDLGVWIHGQVTLADAALGQLDDVPMRITVDTSSLSGITLEPGQVSPTRVAHTQSNGSFEFRAALPEVAYVLEALPEDLAYARVMLSPASAGDTSENTIDLQQGGQISGHVVDAGGRGLAGARITLTYGTGVFGTEGSTVRSGDSDANGAFTLLAVTEGSLQIGADHNGHLQSKRQSVELPQSGALQGIILELKDGKSLAGFARWPDGTPAAGAEIFATFDRAYQAGPTALNAMRGAKARTVADEGGVFVLRGLGNGPFTLRARIDAAQSGRARRDSLRPGQEGIELVLLPEVTFDGRVIDQKGAPVTAFSVHMGRVSAGDLLRITTENRRQDFEDEDGRFHFGDLQEGNWELRIQGDGLITSASVEIGLPIAEEADTLEITLLRSASIAGRVTDPTGQGRTGAEVGLSSGGPAWQQMMEANPFPPKCVTDEEGTYLLTGIPPGGVSVVASHREFAPSDTRPLDLAAGEAREGVDLQLALGGTVTGEVIEEDGSPGDGRMIVLTHMQTQAVITSRTEADGMFRVERVPAGSYQIVALDTKADWGGGDSDEGPNIGAMMKNMKMGNVAVVNGETAHIVLGTAPEDPVRVWGKVTSNKEPVAGAILSFIPEGEDVYQRLKLTTVDAQGMYEVTLDKPGKYVLSVQRIGDSAMQQSTIEFQETIPSADEHHLNLKLPLGRISGVVVDARGKPAAGERITLTVDGMARTDSMLGGQYAEIRTDSAGNFELKELRPGTYRIAAGGAAPYSGQSTDSLGRISIGGLRIGEDEWKRGLQLELPDPGSIEVSVSDSQGNPLPGATLFVRDAQGRMLEPFSMVTSDGSGKVSYNSIAPGEYTISARVSNLTARESAPLRVRAGQTTKSALVLEAGTILWLRIMDSSGDPVAASISVLDENGREVTGLVGMADLQALYMDGAFSLSEHRLGPLPPGKYRVRAEANGVVAEKSVRLRGGEEKRLSLRLR